MIDREEALRIIRDYPTRWQRYEALQDELAMIDKHQPSITAGRLSGVPRGGGVSNPTEAHYIQMEQLRESTEACMAHVLWEIGAVEAALKALTPIEREIVTAREHKRAAWDDIAGHVNYGERQTQRIYNGAIERMTASMSARDAECPRVSRTA